MCLRPISGRNKLCESGNCVRENICQFADAIRAVALTGNGSSCSQSVSPSSQPSSRQLSTAESTCLRSLCAVDVSTGHIIANVCNVQSPPSMRPPSRILERSRAFKFCRHTTRSELVVLRTMGHRVEQPCNSRYQNNSLGPLKLDPFYSRRGHSHCIT